MDADGEEAEGEEDEEDTPPAEEDKTEKVCSAASVVHRWQHPFASKS